MKIERGPVLRWEWLLLAVCMAVGAALRLWFLPKVPGLWYDEAINGLDALNILREPGFPIFFDTRGHMREPLYMYLEAAGVLTGGTSATAIRAVSTLVGIITIPFVWLSARELLGRHAAAMTAVCFALMRWHVHFSGLAFRTILAPLFACLVVLFLARMLRRGSRLDAAACGLFLGLGAYTYLAFRLMPLIVLPPLVIALWQAWRADGKAAAVRQTRLYGIAIVVASLAFAPLGVNYLKNPEHFTGRGGEVTLAQHEAPVRLLLRQARDVALMPLLRGDHVEKHNIPGPPRFVQAIEADPMETLARWSDERDAATRDDRPPHDPHGTGIPAFGILGGLLFYTGVILLAVLPGIPPATRLLVAGWLVIGALASVLSFGAPNMLRLLMLTPAAAMAIGLAVAELSRRAGHIWAAWGGRTIWPVCVAVPAIVFTEQMWVDTGRLARWAGHPMVPAGFNVEWAEMGDFLRDQPDRLPVRMPVDPHPTLVYLADGYEFIVGSTPDGAGRWWELRTEPPLPELEPSGYIRRDSRRLEVWSPAGFRLGVLVEAFGEEP